MSKSRSMRVLSWLGARVARSRRVYRLLSRKQPPAQLRVAPTSAVTTVAVIADGGRIPNPLPTHGALVPVDAAAASVSSTSLLNTGVPWTS
jgi:hypothetical protein